MRFVIGFIIVGILSGLAISPAHSQQRASVPHDDYYDGFGDYFDGEFGEALASFRDSAKGGMRAGDDRYIDAICYHSMLGECYYQLGDLTQALDQFSSSIKYFIANRDWMLRTEFPAGIDVAQQAKLIPWGTTSRTFRVGRYPTHYSTLVGRLDNDKVAQAGGVLANPQLYPVNVIEIWRCLAQSIRRRREILGPICEYEPLTPLILDALNRRPGPPQHWSQCWISVCLGAALHSANKGEQAASEYTQSLLAGGQYEHPLSCVGLLELGKVHFEKGEYEKAGTFFHEASISAGLFDRYEVMEEAFRWGATTWAVLDKQGIYPPLLKATPWAKQKRIATLSMTCLAASAEGALDKGDTVAAAQIVSQANSGLVRSNMARSVHGARVYFATAWLNYQQGKIDAAALPLANAMKWQILGSKRLFQIALVDTMTASNLLTERVAELLYAETLREPTPRDWLVEPHETLAVLNAPHPLPFEHWLEVSLLRRDVDKAINIADRLRRHRFFSTMALGGRLMSLRWVLEAPAESLTKEAQLQRQTLLVKFPKYDAASKRVAQIKQQLFGVAHDAPERGQLLSELAKLSVVQEAMLREIAMRREPADSLFPPLRDTKEVQAKLPDGTLVLNYITTARQAHTFAMTKEQVGHWVVEGAGKIRTDLQELFKVWGLHERTQPVQVSDIADEAWKPIAARIGLPLTNSMKTTDWEKYRELVVIPDKVLWFVPFETLPAGKDATEPLLAKVAIRYAPTLGLAIPDGRVERRDPRMAVVVGKPNGRDTAAILKQLTDNSLPPQSPAERWELSLPGPSHYAAQVCDRLLVLADTDDTDKGPYDWAPLVIDRNKLGSKLDDWFNLPWGGPLEVAFPSYRTAADSGLRKPATGDEIFLSMCGLMSTGARTVLMSRWRMGGKSTSDLMREYHQELSHVPAAESWRRSVKLLWETNLTVADEPRVRGAPTEAIKSQHPLFWSGYVLGDSGSIPVAAKVEGNPPAAVPAISP